MCVRYISKNPRIEREEPIEARVNRRQIWSKTAQGEADKKQTRFTVN